MTNRFRSLLLAATAPLLLAPVAALAHPHVWVTVKSEVMFAPDGSVTGIRHAWTFDDMFSAFAVQGLDSTPDAAVKSEPAGAKRQSETPGFATRIWQWFTGLFGGAKPAEPKPAETAAAAPAAPPPASPPATAPASGAQKYTREQLAPLAKINIESLKEFDFFNYGKADGNKLVFAEPTDYHLEYADAALTLHFVLPLKSALRAKAIEVEVYDPSYFVDFQLSEKNAVALSGAPAGCQLTVGKPQEMTKEMAQMLAQIGPNQQIPANSYGAQFANKVAVKCP